MNIDAFLHLEKMQALIVKLPETYEKLCHGTLGFNVNKKLFARIKEGGETLAVYNPGRNNWIKKNPEIYFINRSLS